jgi:hypothetical protein
MWTSIYATANQNGAVKGLWRQGTRLQRLVFAEPRLLSLFMVFRSKEKRGAYWLPDTGLPAFRILLAAVKMRAAL